MSKDTVTFFPTSPRHEAALRIQDTLFCLDLNDSYGISMERATDKQGRNHWSILFCRARTVDGLVRVYSDRYIQVVINKTMNRFTSYYDAQRFLVQRFANV